MNCELTLNLDEAEWMIAIDGDGHWLDIFIGFTSNGDITEFDNLSFSYSVAVNGEPFHDASYPPEGERYIATDQPYLVTDRLFGFRPDDQVGITLIAENAGIEYEDTEVFTVPRPDQPNPDCVWNEEEKWWDCPEEEPNEDETPDPDSA